jgi:hypothetical protein
MDADRAARVPRSNGVGEEIDGRAPAYRKKRLGGGGGPCPKMEEFLVGSRFLRWRFIPTSLLWPICRNCWMSVRGGPVYPAAPGGSRSIIRVSTMIIVLSRRVI